MRLTFAIIMLALISLNLCCSSNTTNSSEEQEKHIFAKFYIRYLQTEKELKAEVSFKEGDTLANARPIIFNEVLFEGQAMTAQNLGGRYGVRYDFRNRGPHRATYNFQWANDPNQVNEHTMDMSPVVNFLIKEGQIEKQKGFTLVWKGDPLTADQELILLFTDEQKKAFPVNVNGPTDRPEVFIPAEKISGMVAGTGQLMLVKKQLLQSSGSTLTKISEMEFYSNNIDVEILD